MARNKLQSGFRYKAYGNKAYEVYRNRDGANLGTVVKFSDLTTLCWKAETPDGDTSVHVSRYWASIHLSMLANQGA